MIRKLFALALVAGLAALGYPSDVALAANIPIHGVDPTPTIQAYTGDILYTAKPLVETAHADGTLTRRYPVWIDRVDGKGFQITATMLKPLGFVSGVGNEYQVLDGLTPPLAPIAPPISASGPLYGINLSGGEFDKQGNGQLLPTPADLDAYYAVGYRLFRIPFKTTEITASPAKLTALAAECVKLGVPCIFDRHEYAWPAVADQIAFWVPVAKLLGPAAQLDLENEPAGFIASNAFDQWATDSQAIVTGLRAAGVTNRIWLEWPQYTATFRFDKGERAPKGCTSAACSLAKLPEGTIKDPLKASGFEGHRYFDKDGSGTNWICGTAVSIQSFAQQAIPFGLPVMIGEYAFGDDAAISPTCTALAPSIMAEIKAAPNLYGVTAWGGGSRWGSYMFRALPTATSPYIQMTTGK